jgi:hypothetical protein
MRSEECATTVCGRPFSAADVAAIKEFIAQNPSASRREIATWTCETLRWLRPNGQLKEMSCRVALLRLEALELIRLPPPRKRSGNRKPYRPTETIAVPREEAVAPVGQLVESRVRRVESRADSRLWNEAVSRFHYLGYKRLPGAQLRYLVESADRLLGVVGFSASAWKVGPRDRWIGWSEEQRKGNLHLVVNNSRFLILPWIKSRNLASWILARCARRLPNDWEERYSYRPVLLETFVEHGRFYGTCYKAANWICIGETQGRGKLDRDHTAWLPRKQIFVYILERGFRRALCQ